MEILLLIAIIAFFIIKEKFQEYKADKYADQVVKRYDDKKKP